MSPFLPQVLAAWGERLATEGPWRLVLGLLVAGAAFAWTRKRVEAPRWARAPLVVALAGIAVALAARRASVVDDAYIAFRYARNLVEGHGLVFNLDERVEGYTDLAWVLLVAAGNALTGVELPLVALALNLVVVAANVVVAADIGRKLGGPALPLGAALLAVHGVFVAHGTTGLETGFLALLVQLALRSLLAAPGPRSAAATGAWIVLAILTRPDAALFGPIAAAAILMRDRSARSLLALAAPCLLLVAVQAWRVSYYGDWLPNTAHAKSAGGGYWSQGVVYAVEFWLGSASWPMLFATAAWCVRGAAPPAARLFVGASVALHTTYVLSVGGDFMSGRFFVVLLPLLAIATEQAWMLLGRQGRVALLGLLATCAGGGSLAEEQRIRWYIADEGTLYRVKQWSPVVIDHSSYRIGSAVGSTLTDAGITPLMAAGTIGMLGYYGRLPLVDLHGLTDRTVARMEVERRGHVGHEKMADAAYLRARGVKLVQSGKFCGAERWWELRGLIPPTGRDRKKPWCFFQWDPDLAARIRADAPGWHVPNPASFLAKYTAKLPSPAEAAKDLVVLEDFFAHAPRPPELDVIAAHAATATATAPTAPAR